MDLTFKFASVIFMSQRLFAWWLFFSPPGLESVVMKTNTPSPTKTRKGHRSAKRRCLGAVVLFTGTPSAKLLPDIYPAIGSYCRKTLIQFRFLNVFKHPYLLLVYVFYLAFQIFLRVWNWENKNDTIFSPHPKNIVMAPTCNF